MIKLKNEQFENEAFIDALRKIYKQDSFSPRVAYQLNVVYKELERRNLSYLEVKNVVIQKYSVKEDDSVIIPKENVEKYNSDMRELLDTEFEVPFEKIPYADGMKLSAADIEALSPVIDFTALEV